MDRSTVCIFNLKSNPGYNIRDNRSQDNRSQDNRDQDNRSQDNGGQHFKRRRDFFALAQGQKGFSTCDPVRSKLLEVDQALRR